MVQPDCSSSHEDDNIFKNAWETYQKVLWRDRLEHKALHQKLPEYICSRFKVRSLRHRLTKVFPACSHYIPLFPMKFWRQQKNGGNCASLALLTAAAWLLPIDCFVKLHLHALRPLFCYTWPTSTSA